MIGLKFGGITQANPAAIEESVEIAAEYYRQGQRPIVVVSAIKGDIAVTEYLRDAVGRKLAGERTRDIIVPLRDFHYDIASELGVDVELKDDFNRLEAVLGSVGDNSLQTTDSVIIYGERLASKIFSARLERKGIPSSAYNASDVGMLTDDRFGNANPLPEAYALLGKKLSWDGKVKVVTGFEGTTRDGRYTTLGPNSSDFTESVICAGIDEHSPHRVGEIVFFKDTMMMTADPKIVGKEKVKPIHRISYREVAEGGDYASRVIHPHAIDPARKRRIPIKVKDFTKPYEDGTLITEESVTSPYVVKLISNQEGEHMFTVEVFEGRDQAGIISDVSGIFRDNNTSINMISASKSLVTFTTSDEQPNGNLESIAEQLAEKFGKDSVNFESASYIAVIGEGMQDVPGIASRVTTSLAREGINIQVITQPRGELTTVYFVAPEDNHKAVKAVHREFFEGG